MHGILRFSMVIIHRLDFHRSLVDKSGNRAYGNYETHDDLDNCLGETITRGNLKWMALRRVFFCDIMMRN